MSMISISKEWLKLLSQRRQCVVKIDQIDDLECFFDIDEIQEDL